MDLRQQKGLQIVQTSRIRRTSNGWIVPSQSGQGTYMVKMEDHNHTSNCPDQELRKAKLMLLTGYVKTGHNAKKFLANSHLHRGSFKKDLMKIVETSTFQLIGELEKEQRWIMPKHSSQYKPHTNFKQYTAQMLELLENRFLHTLYTIEKYEWDVFMIHFQCVDFIQHPYWKYLFACSLFVRNTSLGRRRAK